ncbi:E3 ubiquitin-protein ligase FANCL-like isoform X2 [Gigantopelta aegis]|uniref:E3 ubiquitin-protein ligase FANCL-like isoform X2 n=1 Tax=Gigantopelta aegis TaxID=1735272 RepID=UPI001B887B50|nr:E3 ubiquitin-protein ligase FANCL-like isoform X2 [Gigantopelta aegis]
MNKQDELSCLEIFPLLIPQDNERLVYDGFVHTGGKDLRLCICLPSSGNLSDATVKCEWRLAQILSRHSAILKQDQQPHQNAQLQTETSVVCSQLISEIENIGWDKLLSVDSTFQNISLQLRDKAERSHIIKIRLSSKHPADAPVISTNLPNKFDFHWNSKSTLRHVVDQFQEVISKYLDFWDNMDEIDKNTWVLEPEQPNCAAVHRRIALDSNASLQIVVDPHHPRMLPECRFLGADQVVNPLREKLNSNLHLWDVESSLLSNLEKLLDRSFPSPSNSKKEEFSMECGICYAYRLEREIPDKVCDDSRCGQPFHRSCLYEWLRVLPSSRQSFNMIFGECPFCGKSITVKTTVQG